MRNYDFSVPAIKQRVNNIKYITIMIIFRCYLWFCSNNILPEYIMRLRQLRARFSILEMDFFATFVRPAFWL